MAGGGVLKFFGTKPRKIRQAVFTTTNIPAAIALVVIAVLGLYADHQNRLVSRQSARESVLAQAHLIRSNLEGSVSGNLQLVRGLVATLSTEPVMDQERFERLAANLFRGDSQLRNIAAAPNFVISMMYPMAGNESAIGLDYRTNEAQREGALRARDGGELVLVGPVALRQGGEGFIGRYPVFVDLPGAGRQFWGIVSAVIDAEKLYRDSGLLDPNLPIEVAIIGADSPGERGTRFFGSEAVIDGDPVTTDVLLPSGSWRLAAVPKGGWDTAMGNAWLFRLAMIVAGALVVIPILIAGRLFEERQKNYRQLRRSERELRQLSRRLELALSASRIGVWEHNLETDELVWDDRVNDIYGKPRDGKPRGFEDWAGAIHPDDVEQAQRDFDMAIANNDLYSSEYRLLLPDGRLRYIRTRAAIYQDASDQPKMIGAEWDVTADVTLRKELERAKNLAEKRNAELEIAKAHIEHNALHDSLTGLPNRRYLDEMLERFVPNSDGVALLHIDLDRFKQINDTLGHAAGDAMLVHAANVLKSNVRRSRFRGPRRRRRVRRILPGKRRRRRDGRACRPHHPPDAPAGFLQRIRMPFRRQRRHRQRNGRNRRRRSGCWSTPTSRFTGPRGAAATATSSSLKRCRKRSPSPSGRRTKSCTASSGTSSWPTTSRNSTPTRRKSSVSRRLHAGATRCGAFLPRTLSCTPPRN